MTRRLVLAFVLLMPAAVCFSAELDSEFEQQVRPILVAKCLKCHGDAKQEGNLRLDSLDGFLTGGDSGPAMVQGDPAESFWLACSSMKVLKCRRRVR